MVQCDATSYKILNRSPRKQVNVPNMRHPVVSLILFFYLVHIPPTYRYPSHPFSPTFNWNWKGAVMLQFQRRMYKGPVSLATDDSDVSIWTISVIIVAGQGAVVQLTMRSSWAAALECECECECQPTKSDRRLEGRKFPHNLFMAAELLEGGRGGWQVYKAHNWAWAAFRFRQKKKHFGQGQGKIVFLFLVLSNNTCCFCKPLTKCSKWFSSHTRILCKVEYFDRKSDLFSTYLSLNSNMNLLAVAS